MKKDKPRGPRRDKSKKPPSTDSMEAHVPNKLSDEQVVERSRRLARKHVELMGLQRRKKNAVKTINADIKELSAEIDQLAEEVVHGEEMLRQGDLFAPKSKQSGSEKVPPAQTKQILNEVAKRAAGPTAVPAKPAPAAPAPATGNGQ